MTRKIMVTINFGGTIDYFEAADYELIRYGNAVVIKKLDGSKIIVSPMNAMIEITYE